jgi:hypothetical protein
MTKQSQTFKVRIKSPYGKQSIEQFEHWLRKAESEAAERWGIEIEIERVEREE